MKKLFTLITIASILFACNKLQTETNNETLNISKPVIENENTFDSVLAKKLGADEYGMKKYVMAFLMRGPNRTHDSAQAARIQKDHMANINRMAEEGKLIVAGPFLDDSAIRGIYIFNVETIEEAEELTKTDPAIQSGRLKMELHPWYGSAALMEINKIHKSLAKTGI
jgi:uncharacterized protein YciI